MIHIRSNTSLILGLIFNFLLFNSFGQIQPPKTLFNIFFENDFNDNSLGKYLTSDFIKDWRLPNGSLVDGNVSIIDENQVNHNKIMRGYFPLGTYLPSSAHGFLWMSRFSNQPEELYFSYDVRFKPGFQWVLSGKLPGLTGGSIVSGVIPKSTDGFSVRIIWQQNGQLAVYLYHQDQPTIYGSVYSFPGFRAESGKWYNLTIRVVLNSVTAGVASKNGILEAFVDGKLLFQKSDLRYRGVESIKIDNMYICSFFGGNTPDFATLRDEWIDTDNYLLFTYNSTLQGVPKGHQLSDPSKELIHPFLPISDAKWKRSLSCTSVDLNSIDLEWNEFPVPTDYILERQEGGSGDFKTISTLQYGTTKYKDIGLKTGVTYTYRVKAGSSVTDALEVTTSHPNFPNAPGNVKISDVTKNSINLSWVDYSDNETGFKLERSLLQSGPFQQIATVKSNVVSYKDQPLNPGTTYYYRLSAFNPDGHSSYTAVISAQTKALQLPAAPGGLTASVINYTSAKIQWIDNSNDETGFEIERISEDESGLSKFFSISSNTTSFLDPELKMNTKYQYRVRSKNEDGYSMWSNIIEFVTPLIEVPSGPTHLKSTEITDQSISICWKDNSSNEDAFILKRSLAVDSNSFVEITINADDTVYTDTNLISGTTYLYKIKAVNIVGSSCESNKNIATTLTANELRRVKDGLIAYYNFGYNPDYIIYDQSGYESPLNLYVLDHSTINWLPGGSLSLLSNSVLVSSTPATKIVRSIKQTGAMTFECWIKPSVPEQGVASRIISLGMNDNELGFILDQNYHETPDDEFLQYSVRLQTESTISSGYPVYYSDQSQSFLNRVHLVYTRDSLGNETLFINGRKSQSGHRPSGLDVWSDSYLLRLGNEGDLDHLWRGSFYLVAIYNKHLTEKEILANYFAGPCNSVVNDMSFRIDVFPNPAKEYVNLTVSPETTSDEVPLTFVRIVDCFGKILYKKHIFNPNFQYNKEIELDNFAPGIYLVQVISGMKSLTKKLIIR